MKSQGTTLPIELPQDRTYTPAKGWKTSRKWQGPESSINALAAQLVYENGSFVNITIAAKEAGLAELTATFDDLQDGNESEAEASGEPASDNDQWSLNGNDYEKDIWSHPTISALATGANKADYDWLRKNLPPIQKNGTWQDVLDVWDSYTWADSSTTRSIFEMFRDGVEAYSVSQYVLRRSRSIRSQAQGQISVGYVGYQFTEAQLRTHEGLPTSLRFALPSSGTWIKRTPSVTFDGNKITVDNEFWHAEDWNAIIYPTR
jgi:hypothetical protein